MPKAATNTSRISVVAHRRSKQRTPREAATIQRARARKIASTTEKERGKRLPEETDNVPEWLALKTERRAASGALLQSAGNTASATGDQQRGGNQTRPTSRCLLAWQRVTILIQF